VAVAIPFMMYAGAAVAVFSSIKQGQAASAAANFNAAIAQQDAAQARSDALAQSIQIQRDNVLRIGSIRAAAGAGGGTGAGSVLDVAADVAAQGELERQWALYQGESRARGYKNTATLDLAQGKAAKQAGYVSAAGAALGGLGAGLQAQDRLDTAKLRRVG